LDLPELSLAMLKFARSSRTAAGHGKLGWRARVVELTALVGYLVTFVDASTSHAWSGLTWSEDLGQLLMYAHARHTHAHTHTHHRTRTRTRAHACVAIAENTRTSRR
jgi:hypothetical protein